MSGFQVPLLTSGPSLVLAVQRDNAVMAFDSLLGRQVKCFLTRMHSSRMRTGRTLTVFRKIGDPPWKNWDPPPKNWRHTHPPPPRQTDLQGMLGYPPSWDWPARHAGIPTHPLLGLTCKACWDTPPPPPWTDTRLWKYYLGQNFVSAGKNYFPSLPGRLDIKRKWQHRSKRRLAYLRFINIH